MTKFILGTNPITGELVELPLEAMLETHTHVLGRTGRGKTRFLTGLCRQIIKERYPLIVIDGVGALYKNLLEWCSEQEDIDPARRILLINPEDTEAVPSINYLELFGGVDAESWSHTVLEGLKKLYQEDTQFKPWLEEWGAATILPLVRAGLTLIEISEFVSQARPEFREAVLSLNENQFPIGKTLERNGRAIRI